MRFQPDEAVRIKPGPVEKAIRERKCSADAHESRSHVLSLIDVGLAL